MNQWSISTPIWTDPYGTGTWVQSPPIFSTGSGPTWQQSPPIINTDPYGTGGTWQQSPPVFSTGGLAGLSPTTLLLLAGAAYFLFFRKRG